MKEYKNPRIFLLGRSMGGAASLVTASRRSEIAGLALWATPNDLHATFKNALGSENYNRLKNGETLNLEDERGSITLTPDFVSDLDNYDLQAMLKAQLCSCRAAEKTGYCKRRRPQFYQSQQ